MVEGYSIFIIIKFRSHISKYQNIRSSQLCSIDQYDIKAKHITV